MRISDVAARLRAMDRVLILTHVRPDGDTIGCAAALCQALRDLGKEAYLLYNPEITSTYLPYAQPYWAPEGWQPEHVVSTDVAVPDLLPANAALYRGRIELAIDHHPSHSYFAAESYVDASAAACGEILSAVIRELTDITPAIALPLYVAISTDTGCFVYSNTTANTHRIAAELMACGIDTAFVNKTLFRTKSKVRLRMEAHMAAHMELYDNDRVVVMQIPLSLREEMHATEADIEELSSLAALVEGTDCAITLRELRVGTVKISVRTGPRVNATEVCARLGGGGHRAAAGATMNGTLDEVKQAVLQAVQEVVGA
ncbi:MAG: phosphoesterase RecJ domain-containing protein [Ruminococcaceae bacterium]|nr:phosphoesterase RecJ domain-containing protein [Oscillospiraceae bacterium]